MRQMVLELNASDDRGIDVVREQIKTFASKVVPIPKKSLPPKSNPLMPPSKRTGTKQIFTSLPSSTTPTLTTYKLIILDEADAMTSTAQMALRRIMEKYTSNTRFCIIANYTHKLSPALLSRCTRFRFSPLKAPDIRRLVDKVIAEENISIEDEATETLVRLSKGDMRRALNVLQACHASSTPLRLKNAPPPTSSTTAHEIITATTIHTCIASPHPEAITHILHTLLSTPSLTTCLTTISALKSSQGLALADILSALSEELARVEVPVQTRVVWLEGLAEVEWRLSGGGGEVVQTGGLVGVVRGGVELMERGGGG